MIFILENIRSKFNIGSIFRISDCFGIEEVVLTGFSKYPPDLEISKTAIGAENIVKWRYFQNSLNAIDFYKKKGKKIISMEISKKSTNIKNYDFTGNEVFIFGNEISGVSKEILEISDEILEIPIKGKIKESLNVSICAGIVAFQCLEK